MLTRLGLVFALVVVAAIATRVPGATVAHAATFTVTKTADTNDGTCDADCSLREAISAANAAGTNDNVTLPAGTYTLTGAAGDDVNASGDLDVTGATTLAINGAGVGTTIIDGGNIEAVFDVKDGAGIFAVTDLTIRNAGGDGIDAGSTDLDIISSRITDNGDGGISTGSGNVDLESSTVDANGDDGVSTNSGNITVTASTVSGNNGDGIATNSGDVNLSNSTISGNVGDNISTNSGDIDIGFSTIADSSDGDGLSTSSGLIFLSGAIVANNDGDDCGQTVEDSDHSLDTDGSCGLVHTGDISDGDPNLGPLQNNGGPTETQALLAGSDAIDAGGDGCPEDDQRFENRPQGAACDIGAYESGAVAQQTTTPSGGIVRTATPTPGPSNTPAPTSTSAPESNTPVPPPPATNTPTGGTGGVIVGPNTGSGPSADGGSGGSWLLVSLAVAAGGAATIAFGVRRRRRA